MSKACSVLVSSAPGRCALGLPLVAALSLGCDPGSSRTPDSARNVSGTTSGGLNGTGGMNADCQGARFCEDFEAYTLGQAPTGPFQSQTKAGSVTVEGVRFVSGEKAARFVTQAGSDSKTAYLRLAGSVFPIQGNAYFGRMLFWLDSAPAEAVHWTLLQAGGVVPGQSYRALYRYGGQHPVATGSQLMANYETPDSYSGNGPGSDCWQHADGVAVPVARWSCVEWQFDGAANTMRLWLDGKAIDSLTVTGSGEGCVSPDVQNVWTAPAFQYLEIGWESYQPDLSRTLYIDDLVLDTKRIGCPSSSP